MDASPYEPGRVLVVDSDFRVRETRIGIWDVNEPCGGAQTLVRVREGGVKKAAFGNHPCMLWAASPGRMFHVDERQGKAPVGTILEVSGEEILGFERVTQRRHEVGLVTDAAVYLVDVRAAGKAFLGRDNHDVGFTREVAEITFSNDGKRAAVWDPHGSVENVRVIQIVPVDKSETNQGTGRLTSKLDFALGGESLMQPLTSWDTRDLNHTEFCLKKLNLDGVSSEEALPKARRSDITMVYNVIPMSEEFIRVGRYPSDSFLFCGSDAGGNFRVKVGLAASGAVS